jgi:hypothetical protein
LDGVPPEVVPLIAGLPACRAVGVPRCGGSNQERGLPRAGREPLPGPVGLVGPDNGPDRCKRRSGPPPSFTAVSPRVPFPLLPLRLAGYAG